jgi:hypothetical protein
LKPVAETVLDEPDNMSLLQPDIKIMKRRIDDLTSREYLERDLEKANTYRFLA